ncbi:hypothetical protein CEXT_686091 [Caerostris extrusa]|uniref:Uncharacterized protein n=1 Tax=Caerostris extrusa TaxID=172846 RepID=A0AAV4Y3R4_CAEEX|nr:hypothetical protein CEXT_686091 [Caerostris extrusa]
MLSRWPSIDRISSPGFQRALCCAYSFLSVEIFSELQTPYPRLPMSLAQGAETFVFPIIDLAVASQLHLSVCFGNGPSPRL